MATMGTTTTTPEQAPRSPQRHALAITEAQKQALVDNLQLEVTERARKLRAQYALQAHGLKTRLELRVNRIPHSLRTMKMQDLVDKHVQQHLRPTAASSAVPLKHPQHQQHDVVSNMPSPAKRGIKRSSDDFPIASDKENTSPQHPLSNPKKRSKPSPYPSAPSTLSQQQQQQQQPQEQQPHQQQQQPPPSTSIPTSPAPNRQTRIVPPSTVKRIPPPITVLSPKSHNTNTRSLAPPTFTTSAAHRSPLKSPLPASAIKPPYPRPATATSHISRPTRPASRLGLTKARPGTALGLSPERPSTRTRKARGSSASDSSTGTTIVRAHSQAQTYASASPRKVLPPTPAPAPASTTFHRTPAAPVLAVAPAPKPARPPPPEKKEGKRGGIKNAFNSLTGSKKGKAAAAAAAAAVAANQQAQAHAQAPAPVPSAGGRVLRKRA